jgi:hypothetical protein
VQVRARRPLTAQRVGAAPRLTGEVVEP